MKFKVGWNATDLTLPMCPSRAATQVASIPLGEKRHNFIVLSQEPVAIRGAVGWNATEVTSIPSLEKRHNFAVLSSEPVAKKVSKI